MSEYIARFRAEYQVTDEELTALHTQFGSDLENYYYQALTGALILIRLKRTDERLARIEKLLETPKSNNPPNTGFWG